MVLGRELVVRPGPSRCSAAEMYLQGCFRAWAAGRGQQRGMGLGLVMHLVWAGGTRLGWLVGLLMRVFHADRIELDVACLTASPGSRA